MTPLECLNKALEKLNHPDSWTKGTMARDEHGKPIGPKSTAAVSWCVIGALNSLRPTGYNRTKNWIDIDISLCKLRGAILETVVKNNQPGWRMGGISIDDWNDHPDTNHEMIVDILQKTRENL